MGAISDFLDKNVSEVDLASNVFDLNCEFLLLAFAEKVFSDIEMFEAFCCCCFSPVAACAVVVVDDGGQGDVRHVQIGDTEAEVNSIFDTLVIRYDL